MPQTTVESPRFADLPALETNDPDVDREFHKKITKYKFASYWQRWFQGIYRDEINIASSRNTGITLAIATGTVINHGLKTTPKYVVLAPQDGTPTNYFASGITKTQFTVNYTGGGTHIFGWSAET